MAWALIQGAAGESNSDNTFVDATFAQALTPGNLVCGFTWDGYPENANVNAVATYPSGDSLSTPGFVNNSDYVSCLWGIVVASGKTVIRTTHAATQTYKRTWFAEFSGQAANPFDTHDANVVQNYTTASNACIAGPLSLAQNNELVVALAWNGITQDIPNAGTSPDNWITILTQSDAAGDAARMTYLVRPSGNTTATFTQTASENHTTAAMALKMLESGLHVRRFGPSPAQRALLLR